MTLGSIVSAFKTSGVGLHAAPVVVGLSSSGIWVRQVVATTSHRRHVHQYFLRLEIIIPDSRASRTCCAFYTRFPDLFILRVANLSLSLFLANSLLFGCKIYHDALYKEGYLIVSILYIYITTLERIFANKNDGIWLELARCKVNGIKIRVYLTIHDTSTRDIEVLHPGFGISTELSF